MEAYLFGCCARIFGNQIAVDALYDFNADIFIGDSLTSCSWIMSDILGCVRFHVYLPMINPTPDAHLAYGQHSSQYTLLFLSGIGPS